jgi:hemolysin D
MQLLPRPSSKAISITEDRLDPTLPAILEYQNPSAAILNYPMPRIARSYAWIISALFASMLIATGLIKVDRVVTAQGVVVTKAADIVLQPLEEAVVRSIDVKEGDVVHAGQVLARLDPTFAASDLDDALAQVSSFQAQVARLEAELNNKPFTYSGTDPNMLLQLSAYLKRQAQYSAQVENYDQKAKSLQVQIAKANGDLSAYTERLGYAKKVEQMRVQLEQLNVGSKLNTESARDTRAEMERNVDDARETIMESQRDLAAAIADRNQFVANWHADVAEKLTDALGKLADARQALGKAQLRRQLVELRAQSDGTVMSIGKIAVGSVVKMGDPMITVVPTDAPLEIEANIPADDNGYVHLGDPVNIKFATFPFFRYGMAHGTVRLISPSSFTAQDETRNPTGALPVPQAGMAGGAANGAFWYRSRITLDKVALRNVPTNFHLVPGMPVTADINVGKHTVLNYLLGRFAPLATDGMREP